MSTDDIKTSEWLEDIEIRAEYGSATFRYDIASALVAARKMRNLTQAALAKIAGVSQAYIAKLESGEANPTIGRIGAILASIWLKCEIKLVPLISPEHQEDTSSASSSLSISSTIEIAPSTINDIGYQTTSDTSSFEQQNIFMYYSEYKHMEPSNAAF